MEVKVESRIGKLCSDSESIYAFLSDCNNFKQFAASEKIKDWQSDTDSCSFATENTGNITFRIIERRPSELIKMSIENIKAENILLWLQLKSVDSNDTRVKLTTKLKANPVMKMLISKPLKAGLDKVVEVLETICK